LIDNNTITNYSKKNISSELRQIIVDDVNIVDKYQLNIKMKKDK